MRLKGGEKENEKGGEKRKRKDERETHHHHHTKHNFVCRVALVAGLAVPSLLHHPRHGYSFDARRRRKEKGKARRKER